MNKSKPLFLATLSLAILVAVSCGKKDEQPAPVAQAPVTPATVAPAPTIQGTNCPVVSGSMPLSQSNGSMFYGNLTLAGNSSAGAPSAIALNIQLLNYAGIGGPQTVVAGGNVYLPDMARLNQTQVPNQNFNICVSTASVSGGAPAIPGTYTAQYNGSGMIQMTLQGPFQVPTMPQFSGTYNPTPTFVQDYLTVTMGASDSPTYLVNGKILGCLKVKLGSNYQAPVFYYQAN